MATGNDNLSTLFLVAGVRVGVAEAGIRKANRKDLVVFELAENSSVAAVFTQNAFCAAPVVLSRKHLAAQPCRYWLVNTGCANAGTGAQGLLDASDSCAALAKLAGVKAEQVLPFSTGVIGEPLPMPKLLAGLPLALSDLKADNWLHAAEGIMTTDTRPKGVSKQLNINGKTVTLTGICKGAGMIKPNMATLLAFVATDAAVAQRDLQPLLAAAVNKSFNRITIDGDTSTNDSCLLAATGASGCVLSPADAQHWPFFAQAVEQVFVELAQLIVRDGEGATKFITVEVNGGADNAECLKAAYAIAESPLVKTALFASDPNWGRVLAAIGRSGINNLKTETVNIFLNDAQIVAHGGRADTYTEEQGQAAMAPENIVIRVELGRGAASETVWTCDFSHEYVSINADYRS